MWLVSSEEQDLHSSLCCSSWQSSTEAAIALETPTSAHSALISPSRQVPNFFQLPPVTSIIKPLVLFSPCCPLLGEKHPLQAMATALAESCYPQLVRSKPRKPILFVKTDTTSSCFGPPFTLKQPTQSRAPTWSKRIWREHCNAKPWCSDPSWVMGKGMPTARLCSQEPPKDLHPKRVQEHCV